MTLERVYHTWDRWECYPAGLYEMTPPEGMTSDQAYTAYADFLRSEPRFRDGLAKVLREWPNSCEHYLSNENMNRIAWLGQASACAVLGISRQFRSGFHRLKDREKVHANRVALEALNQWLVARGEPALSLDDASSKTKMDLY